MGDTDDADGGLVMNLGGFDSEPESTARKPKSSLAGSMRWTDRRRAMTGRKRKLSGDFSSRGNRQHTPSPEDGHSRPVASSKVVHATPAVDGALREPLWRKIQRESTSKTANDSAREPLWRQFQRDSMKKIPQREPEKTADAQAHNRSNESHRTAINQKRQGGQNRQLKAPVDSHPGESGPDPSEWNGYGDIEDEGPAEGDDTKMPGAPEQDTAASVEDDSSAESSSSSSSSDSDAESEGTSNSGDEEPHDLERREPAAEVLDSDVEDEAASDADETNGLDSSQATALRTASREAERLKAAERGNKTADSAPQAPVDDGLELATNEYLFDGTDFESLNLSPTLTRHVQLRVGLQRPTKVQAATVEALVPRNGPARDGLVRSETGSGKTLSFLLPIAHTLLERMRKVERTDGTLAIILEPTRELAAQVEMVARKLFLPWHWIVVGAVMGGEKKKSEKARLRRGVTVLITTPGRLVDHLRSTQSLQLANCEWLILDEGDRLLDLGFGPNIKEAIETLDRRAEDVKAAKLESGKSMPYRKRRQTVLLSATMTEEVAELAKVSLEDPKHIILSGGKDDIRTPASLSQHYCVAEERHRLITLIAILRLRAQANPHMKAVVFFSSCDAVDFHHALFQRVQFPEELAPAVEDSDDDSDEDENADKKKKKPKVLPQSLCMLPLHRLHGNMSQLDRISTFRKFSTASNGILLSTDVAARGLDLSALSLSVQYDPPTHDEDVEYVHRAGRTARMGRAGDALIFVLPAERAFVDHLEKDKGFALKEILADAALAALKGKTKNKEKAARQVTSILQSCLQNAVENDRNLKVFASNGYRSFVKAYATHSHSVKQYFHPKNLHLGHVARSFALKSDPLSVAEARRVKEAETRKAMGLSDKRGPAASGASRVGRGDAVDTRGPQASEGKRRRRTTLRAPNARSLLSSEFGA